MSFGIGNNNSYEITLKYDKKYSIALEVLQKMKKDKKWGSMTEEIKNAYLALEQKLMKDKIMSDEFTIFENRQIELMNNLRNQGKY